MPTPASGARLRGNKPVALAAAAIASTLLVTLHPLVMPLVPVVLVTAAGRALAHFHRRA